MPAMRDNEARKEYNLTDYHKNVRDDFRKYLMKDRSDAEYLSRMQHPG